MGTRSQAPTEKKLAEIRHDEQTREDVETLAEREDYLGATARVVLAVADDEQPSKADCREAGLMSIWERYEGGPE